MKPRIYIETSVFSYLTSKPSHDQIAAANQQITQEWWTFQLSKYDGFISEIVMEEARSGDESASRKRLEIIRIFPRLELTSKIENLARKFISDGIYPSKALRDAFHVAIATFHGMDYPLTWNCKHIANASLRRRIEVICHNEGYEIPVICTPQELLGE